MDDIDELITFCELEDSDVLFGSDGGVLWCEFGDHPAEAKVVVYVDGEYDGEVYCCLAHRTEAEAEMHRRLAGAL